MNRICVGVVAAVLALRTSALGTVTATVTSGLGSTSVNQLGNGEWEVTLTKTTSDAPTDFLVKGSTTDVVSSITVSNSGANTARVTIHGPTSGQGIGQVKIFTNGSSTGPVQILNIKTVGDVGGTSDPAIQADSITAADIGDDVLNDIVVEAGNLAGFVVAGDFLADLAVTGGSIVSLAVTGTIGTSSQLQTIDVNTSGSGGTIDSITASAIRATITADANVQHIETTSGDFRGSLTADEFSGGSVNGLDVAGNLNADITVDFVFRPIVIDGDLVSGRTFTVNSNVSIDSNGSLQVLDDLEGTLIITGTLAANRTLRIGDTLSGTLEIGTLAGILDLDNLIASGTTALIHGSMSGSITIASSGLDGQFIINANDGGGTWSGSITVGATTLSPVPDYSNLSSALGGGAIGVIPFDFHSTDCPPEHGDVLISAPLYGPGSTEGAIIRHYGPIINGSEDRPIDVGRRPLTGGSWTDASDDFDYTVQSTPP